MDNDIIDTWRFHTQLTLDLLEAVPDIALMAIGETSGRPVGAQFAHLHTVRIMWLEASAPDLMAGLNKIPTRSKADKESITKELLMSQLSTSALAIERLLKRALQKGAIKNFKGGLVRFLGYLIAHESYHWGEIGIILKESGQPLNKDLAHRFWEWW